MSWKVDSLNRLFNPESIAIIGASNQPNKLGSLTLRALKESNARKYPVNPRHSEINGLRCYFSLTDIGEDIDLAVIALGPLNVLPALKDCAEANVGGAIIFSAGFKELGPLGEEHQVQVKEVADAAHIAVIGPNCLGAGNPRMALNATFFPHPVPVQGGSVALVSQSGGVAGLMLYEAADTGVGVSKFASIGNRVNIDFHDTVRYLGQDDETEVICLFVEGTENARSMYDEMAQVTMDKPIIMYKVGKTPTSRKAALSHTGSLAGRHELYSAAARQSGAIEANTVTEMIDTAKILSICGTRPTGRNVAIVTHTLGPSLIAAQILENAGSSLPPPSQETSLTIQQMLAMPVEIGITNPVDLLAQGWANPEIFAGAFNLIMEDPQYDAVVIVFQPNYQEDIGGGVPIDSILKKTSTSEKTVIAILNSPVCTPPIGKDRLERGRVPVFSSPERAAQALSNVLSLPRSA
ncbi:MAG: acetate--CoA ligase family protein [Candidatus Thorarchaeota archaeon]